MTPTEKSNVLRDSVKNMLSTSAVLTELRSKQREAFRAMQDKAPDEIARSYYKLPTGFGKTVMFAIMVREFSRALPKDAIKNNKILILVPRLALFKQTQEKLATYMHVTAGEFNGTKTARELRDIATHDVIISTYQSLDKLLKTVGMANIGLVIADEAHHALGDKKAQILEQLADHSPIIGFTATPTYSDSHKVADLLGTEIFAMDIRGGVESGMLSPVKNILYRTSFVFDATNAKASTAGDYDWSKMPKGVKLDALADEIAKIYANGGDGARRFCDMRTMINCPTIEIAKTQAERINEIIGRPVACAMHSADKNFEKLKSEFESGLYSVACQVNTLTEGFDDETVSLCINYPSRSVVRIEQSAGRAIRLNPNNPDKVAYVLDTIFRGSADELLDDTLITAAQSGQVLFRNVAGDSILFPGDFADVANTRSGSKHTGTRQKSDTDWAGGKFDLIVDSDKLLEIQDKYNQWLVDSAIPDKGNWLAASELKTVYINADYVKIQEALKELKRPGYIELRKTKKGAITICLNPDKIDWFLEQTKLESTKAIPDKDTWLAAHELSFTYIQEKGPTILAALEKQGEIPGYIEKRKKNGKVALCLNPDKIGWLCDISHLRIALQKKNNWLGATELSKQYVDASIAQVKSALDALGTIPGYIEKRQSGNKTLNCLNPEKIGWFCEQTRFIKKSKSIGNWLSSTALVQYVSAKSEKITAMLIKLGEIDGCIERRRSANGLDALCLNPDKIGWFCQQTGLKRKDVAKSFAMGTAIVRVVGDIKQTKTTLTPDDGNQM